MKTTKHNIHRRDFLNRTAGAVSTLAVLPSSVLGREGNLSPNDKLILAAIGVGGRGEHNIGEFKDVEFAALCDVDDERAAKTYNRFESVPKYKDFRVMLDKHPEVDAVVVSTPDHTHAIAALDAIRRGKHVYLEKPLAHTVHEVRVIQQAAREHGVITQLGNQGHSDNDIRKICEWIAEGAIGPVREVQLWYKRQYGDGKPRPQETPPVPDCLDWNLWLGPAPYRPYHSNYLPGKWRSWADFGTGVLGDWVCHILDPSFWALNLQAPSRITAINDGGDYSPERFPTISTIRYDFPARGAMPPVEVVWTYGKGVDLPQLEGLELNDWNRTAGALLIGEKGSIFHGSHGGGGARILPESLAQEVGQPKETIPRIKGGHHRDWVRCCKEKKPASSNFDYGAPLSEVALLGVIATRFDRETLEWDAVNMKYTNRERANEYLQSEYQNGWTL